MAKVSILPGQLRLILAITAVHTVAWFAYLSHVPLGQYLTPVEQSNLDTAFALAQGTLQEGAKTTFYQYGLSTFAHFIGSEQTLVNIARGLNALALIFAASLCAQTAARYWKKNRPMWLTGLLVGLNPVLIFWSAEISPTLLAVLCAAIAYARLLLWMRRPSLARSLLIGLILAVASALETSLIIFLAAWPIVAWLHPDRKKLQHLGRAMAGPAIFLVIILVSSIQLQEVSHTSLSGLGRSIYETFNSHEVYDGKSYNLHNEVNYFLFINPLHWGIIFLMAAAGCYARFKNKGDLATTTTLLAILGLFVVGYHIMDGGSQARALLYPLLAIHASGCILIPRIWKRGSKWTQRKILLGAIALAGLTYSDFYGARSHTHWERDYAFLARANLELGYNQSAEEWASKAIELNPSRDDMRSILVRSVLNEWALSANPRPLTIETTKEYLATTLKASADDPHIRAIEGIYHFKLRDAEHARSIWREYQDQSALALVCLYWTGSITKPRISQVDSYSKGPYQRLAAEAIRINRNSLNYSEGEEMLDNMLANAH